MQNFFSNAVNSQFICEDNSLNQQGFICEDNWNKFENQYLKELAKSSINNTQSKNILNSGANINTSITTSISNPVVFTLQGNFTQQLTTNNLNQTVTTSPLTGTANVHWPNTNAAIGQTNTWSNGNWYSNITYETEIYEVMGGQFVLNKIYDTNMLLTLAQINFHGYKFYLELLKVNFPFPFDLACALSQRLLIVGRNYKIDTILEDSSI